MAYEEPAYEVVREYHSFELRRYGGYLVAETVVTGDFGKAGNDAFRILFGYISGKNRGRKEIPMTAPVEMAPDPPGGERIPMTAPVSRSAGAGAPGSYAFTFMMPSGTTLETLPVPDDPRVRLRRVEPRLVAALAYSGTWSEKRYREKEAALLAAVEAAGLTVGGPPVFARYDPPFMPWFLRRNEVLVDVLENP